MEIIRQARRWPQTNLGTHVTVLAPSFPFFYTQTTEAALKTLFNLRDDEGLAGMTAKAPPLTLCINDLQQRR